MNIISFFFRRSKADSPDVLGRYPEHMQVPALPERRYLKTSRLLALFIFLNLAALIAIAGFYTYYADRVDVRIFNRNLVHLYTLDSSRQVLIPSEHATKRISSIVLFSEKLLRNYIYNRHSIVWDNAVMKSRWDIGGPVHIFSSHKKVYAPFRVGADGVFAESRTVGFVRDVHIYELKLIKANLWEAVIDTFDMPIPDAYKQLCPCTDNSKACLSCKEKHAYRRLRHRVFIRTTFNGPKTLGNPLGFLVESYNMLYTPIHKNENFWKVPNDLKPEL